MALITGEWFLTAHPSTILPAPLVVTLGQRRQGLLQDPGGQRHFPPAGRVSNVAMKLQSLSFGCRGPGPFLCCRPQAQAQAVAALHPAQSTYGSWGIDLGSGCRAGRERGEQIR